MQPQKQCDEDSLIVAVISSSSAWSETTGIPDVRRASCRSLDSPIDAVLPPAVGIAGGTPRLGKRRRETQTEGWHTPGRLRWNQEKQTMEETDELLGFYY